MTIDAYLAELERMLPRVARRRPLAEIREHLRDAAAGRRASGASQADAEAAATRDFGPVEDVARRLGAELSIRETRGAAVLALLATAFFVFPLYVVPENTLPPATWVEKPADIAALQAVSVGLWIAACACSAVGACLAWTPWRRLAAPALLCAAGAVTGSIVASAALVLRWFAVTPATPNWALAAPLAAACLGGCIVAAEWARSRRALLVPG